MNGGTLSLGTKNQCRVTDVERHPKALWATVEPNSPPLNDTCVALASPGPSHTCSACSSETFRQLSRHKFCLGQKIFSTIGLFPHCNYLFYVTCGREVGQKIILKHYQPYPLKLLPLMPDALVIPYEEQD